jgi:hypothetical protein
LVVNGSLHPLSARQAAAMPPDDDWMVWPQGGPGVGREVCEVAHRFDALFIFGGDTAFEVLQALDCPVLRSVGEIVPGVPLSVLNVEGRELVFITKAGGFGPVDIVESIRSHLEFL